MPPKSARPRPEKGFSVARRASTEKERREPRPEGSGLHTLAIDVGGTGIKMIVLDDEGRPINERSRELTPKPDKPDAVLRVIAKMIETQPKFDRVSVGFPGVVIDGVVKTAPNLDNKAWRER